MSSDPGSSPHAHFGSAPYSAEEEERLSSLLRLHLSKEEISSRAGNKGARFNYVEVTTGIGLANAIFSFDGWSSSVQDVTVDFVDEAKGDRFNVGVSVILRVTLRNGAYHEDIGYGGCTNMPDKGQAIEKAKKEAVSDALKRALRLFGNKLGLSIADKEYMRKLQSGQIRTESLDLDNPQRKRQKLEDTFSASTAPPGPAPSASPSSPTQPPPPQPPCQPPSTSPNRAPAAAARPQFPLPNPFSSPAPTPSLPPSAQYTPGPLAPYNRPPLPVGAAGLASGAAQKPSPVAPSAAGRENVPAGAPPAAFAATNSLSALQHPAHAPADSAAYASSHWTDGATAGGYGASSGPPLPLPSLSGIISSLKPPSQQTGSQAAAMPYGPPSVKQEPVVAVPPGQSMPPPAPPPPKSPSALQPSFVSSFPSATSSAPYAPLCRPYGPVASSSLPLPGAAGGDCFPALPAGLEAMPRSLPRSALSSHAVDHATGGASLPFASPQTSSPHAVLVSPPTGAAVAASSHSSLLSDADDHQPVFLEQLLTVNQHSARPFQQAVTRG